MSTTEMVRQAITAMSQQELGVARNRYAQGVVDQVLSGGRIIGDVSSGPVALQEVSIDERAFETFSRPTREMAHSGLLGPDGESLLAHEDAARPILLGVREVSAELWRSLEDDPSLMHRLDGHKFEEVVAELLARSGYEVTLGPRGKDGGVDVYAAHRQHVGTFLYLVQCKRQKPSRPVGLDVVQRLYGRVASDNATAGVAMTTSRFTNDARKYAQQVDMRMSLKDFADLADWFTALRSRRSGQDG